MLEIKKLKAVINKKEIQTSGALNVSELLSQRSGMSISTSVEGSSVLNILGMDSRYISSTKRSSTD